MPEKTPVEYLVVQLETVHCGDAVYVDGSYRVVANMVKTASDGRHLFFREGGSYVLECGVPLAARRPLDDPEPETVAPVPGITTSVRLPRLKRYGLKAKLSAQQLAEFDALARLYRDNGYTAPQIAILSDRSVASVYASLDRTGGPKSERISAAVGVVRAG